MSVRRWLLVEDDDVDAMTVRRALKSLGEDVRLERVVDGQQALAWLRWGGGGETSLILLDLNMPRVNGMEVLRALAEEPALKRAPVVVWSTSSEDGERIQSLMLGASAYFVKGMEYESFLDTMKEIVAIEKKEAV